MKSESLCQCLGVGSASRTRSQASSPELQDTRSTSKEIGPAGLSNLKVFARAHEWNLVRLAKPINQRNIMTELEVYLKELGVTCSAEYYGKDKDRLGWSHFKWGATLEYDGRTMTVPYRMGIAHYTLPERIQREEHPSRWDNHPEAIPTPPTVGDVVSSLLLEASALDESFSEWCDSLGYDEDSRKALDAYFTCQENGRGIQKLLGSKFSALQNLEY